MVHIKNVKTKSELKAFIKFQWEIYPGHKYPLWVPPLMFDYLKKLDKKKGTFFKFGDAEFFLAYKDGKVVGRIAGIHNRLHNDFHKDKTGFFGFFECVEDQEVANALFDAVAEWLRGRGLEWMRGPASYSSNDEYGLLVEGEPIPPFIMMPYTPPYYKKLIENYGFKKEMDLYAWKYTTEVHLNEKLLSLAEKIKEKNNFRIRYLDKKNLRREAEIVGKIYQEAWKENWGFVPLHPEELKDIADLFAMIAYPEMLVFVLNEKGEEVAFALSIHNLNEELIKHKKIPFGSLQLFSLKQLIAIGKRIFLRRKNKFETGRLILAGVLPEYRNTGADLLLYIESLKSAKKVGYKWGELSWTLEVNTKINNAISKMGGELYKVYRIYGKEI